jgi:hypothetical protein
MKQKRKTKLGKQTQVHRLPGGAAAGGNNAMSQTPPPRRIRPRPDPAAGGAFSILDFCAAHSISRAQYYVMKAAGHGPREFRAGRILISYEAAKEWRRQREAFAAKMSPVPDADDVGSGGVGG